MSFGRRRDVWVGYVLYNNVGSQYRMTKYKGILFHGDIYEEMDT